MINIRSPFRLPLGGGGTDLPEYYSKFGGFLVTAAIDKYMYLAINRPALVDKIMVRYSETETVNRVEDVKHDIARNVLLALNHHGPIHINSMADIAAGTGLGSSSAYAVGLIKGLAHLQRRYLPLNEIAELACKVEIEMCKKPIGKQDQYASTFGGLIVLNIDNTGKVEVSPLNIEEETLHDLEHRLMMFYTNIQRDANEILGEQSQKVNADDSVVIESMHRIKAIAKEIKEALERGDVTRFGKSLHEHWIAKKKITTSMSNSRIDAWYDVALNNGALGGKLMGAGGGGFFLFMTKPERRKSLRKILEKAGLRYMPFAFDMEGAKVTLNL
jgi:D-glycero-alpha-D-manno-heptose-7-phosphate kinase